MIAWVLILALGSNQSIAVPGIASEAACQALIEKLKAKWILKAPTMQCFSYEATGSR